MEKGALKLLVVDDDNTFGKSVVEGLKKAGFSAVHVAKPDEALNASRMQVLHGYVIDCLLPKTSGVDLAKTIRSQVGAAVPIFLTSGIYKDKTFAKEALGKTGSQGFFEKPFPLQDLIKALETALQDLIDEPIEPFFEMLHKANATPMERVKAIPAQVHGYELLRAIGYLMNPAIRGTLQLSEGGITSGISFTEGKVTRVTVKDPESYFGALLVEKNFVSPEELEHALSAKSSKKRIGERLVDANLISPHVIAMINAEQMAIRLSKLIRDTLYEARFVEESTSSDEANIDHNLMYSFFSDWIASKLGITFLRAFYLPLLTNRVAKTPQFNESHPINNHAPLSLARSQVARLLVGGTLQQVIDESPQDEELILGAVHLLVITGQIAFDRSLKTTDLTSQIARLKKIKDDLSEKNHFEILGLTQKAKSNDFRRAYHELAKVFHPDKLPPDSPQELTELTREIFAKMTLAYEALSDDASRASYLKELEQGRADKILASESLFEEGKAMAKSGQFGKALEKFQGAIALRPPTSDLILHSLWARLMTLSQSSDQARELSDVERGLTKIPPEDRHTATYYFVKGLFQKFIGDMELAKRNMEHSLSLNPNFVEARRELNVLRSAGKNKPIDIFNDDLSSVVTQLFKKKR